MTNPGASPERTAEAPLEARFRRIFEHFRDAFLLIEPAEGRILDVNGRACEMLEYAREELLALPVTAVHPEGAKLGEFAERVVREGEGFTDELTCVTRSGTALPAEISAAAVDLDGRRCIAAAVRDVSDRVEAETARRHDRERLEALVDERTEELRLSERRSRLLLDISTRIAGQLERDDLFAAVTEALGRALDFDRASLSLLDEARGVLRTHTLAGASESLAILPEGAELPLEGSRLGEVLASGRAKLIPDLSERPDRTPFEQRLVGAGLRSTLLLPLQAGDRKLGALAIGSASPDRYGEEDAELLTEIAGQVSLAVEKMLTYEEIRGLKERLERRAAALEASREETARLLELTNAVVSTTRRQELFGAVASALARFVTHDRAAILLYSDDREELVLYALAGELGDPTPWEIGTRMPPQAWRTSAALDGRHPVIVPDLSEDPASDFEERLAALGVRCLLSVPLRVEREVIGMLVVARREPGAYGDEDAATLERVAGQVAIAAERMLAFEEILALKERLERRSAELRQLLEVNRAILGSEDRDALFDAITSALKGSLRLDRSALLIHRPERAALELYALSGPSGAERPIPLGALLTEDNSVLLEIVDTGAPLIVPDLREHATELETALAGIGLRSLAIAPLSAGERVIGAISIGSWDVDAYDEADGELLARVGSQVAHAVEKMLAFEEISHLKARLERENLYLQEEIKTEHNFEEIVGESPALLRALRAVETVAPTDAGVLVCGETGTGKELIARALHDLSERSGKPLVKVNCAAIPAGLVESEFFGHEKGAFTGAVSRKTGRFELADGGTIFLDEIGDLPLDLQAKLLRVLQEGEFERIGSPRTLRVDVRVIAATNRDLRAQVREGRFRSDLYYRLAVFPIELPPLRERPGDIRLLVNYFATKFGRRLGTPVRSVPPPVMRQLESYEWPGNVRELQNVIERAVIVSRGEELELGGWFPGASADADPAPLELDEVQRRHIVSVLERTGWKVSGPGGAAELLGMKPTTLEYRMKKLGIERPD